MAGSLRVRIIEGRQMVPMDSLGTSDPFVKVTFGGATHTTRVDFRTLNPKWDAEKDYVFMVDKPVVTARFEAYDYDAVGSNDFMGAAELTLGQKNTPKNAIVWLDLKPRDGDLDDLALSKKYGGLGQIRVAYSYTFYGLSRFLASQHLLDQLNGTVDGAKLIKTPVVPPPDFSVISQNFARLGHHFHNFMMPLVWLKIHTLGYQHVLEDKDDGPRSPTAQQDELRLTVKLVDAHRTTLYLLVTCMCLMAYLPFEFAERLGRAAVPFTLLFIFRFFAKASTWHDAQQGGDEQRGGIPDYPFKFAETRVFMETACGVDAKYIAENHNATSALATATNFVTQGSSKMAGLVTGMVKTAANVASGVASNVMSPLGVSSDKSQSREGFAAAALREKEQQDQELKAVIEQSGPYIVAMTDMLEDIRSVFSWAQQDRTEAILKKTLSLLVVLLVNPLPPAVVVWLAFTYCFVVPRLQHTNKPRYDFIQTIVASNYIERMVRTTLGWAGIDISVQSLSSPDAEDPLAPNADTGVSSDHPVIPNGTEVTVSLEKETTEGSDIWVMSEEQGRITAYSAAKGEYTIDWCDGESPAFQIPTSFVKERVGGGEAGSAAAGRGAEVAPEVPSAFKPTRGDRVVVRYEEESPEGGWCEQHDFGTVVSVSGRNIAIDWGDDESLYHCDVSFVSPADAADTACIDAAFGTSSVPALLSTVGTTSSMAASGGTAAPPALDTGNELAVVSYERESETNPEQWETDTAPAVIVSHLRSGMIAVRWIGEDGSVVDHEQTYASPPQHVTPLGFSLGEAVTVTYEREEEAEVEEGKEPAASRWVSDTDVGIIHTISSSCTDAVIRWKDHPDDAPYVAPLASIAKLQ